MPDTHTELQTRIDYGRYLPFVHLFRAFRIAFNVRAMLLGGMALFLIALGDWAISQLPFAPEGRLAEVRWPWESHVRVAAPQDLSTVGDGVSLATNWGPLLEPLRPLTDPAMELLRVGDSAANTAFSFTRLFWALAVWAVFAGAICRIAAVQFARDVPFGLRASLRFSTSRFFSLFAAPLLPIVGVALIWLMCLLGGLVGRIPVAGGWLVGGLYGLPLLFAFFAVLILAGLFGGLPLMFATISTEDSDGFDGFSRANSFVFSRTWHYLWLLAVALSYGAVILFFVVNLARLIVYLAGWGVAAGMGAENLGNLMHDAPPPFAHDARAAGAAASETGGVGASLAGAWLGGLAFLVHGFVASYFWTASTIIYFILRRSDDGTELDDIYLSDEEQHDSLPLVGVAASDLPVIERPPIAEEPTQPDVTKNGPG